ncbi:MAG TPA: chorismate mutase [Stellaceae bacterium]|nr:chorismate mutase [Stellaceae bacterium]
MTKPPRTLKTLRRHIDDLDDRMHDLLMQRAVIVAEVALAKKAENIAPEAPMREAELLRRLAGRHKGAFPRGAMVRLWREMIGAAIVMQTDFSVAVAVPDSDPGVWDLARDHYGSQAAMTPYRTSVEVLRALGENRASAGVVPVPGDGAEDQWWRALASVGSGPRIVARLPFAGRGNARGNHDAFVLNRGGDGPPADRSLFVLETRGEISRGGLVTMLGSSGVDVSLLAMARGQGDMGWSLIDIGAAVTPDDPLLPKLLAPLGERVTHVMPLGSYARGLAEDAPASRP